MYYLFGGDFCYASGGVNDFIVKAQDLDALTMLAVYRSTEHEIDWWHIVNENMEIICGTEVQAHDAPYIKQGNNCALCYDGKENRWEWK